MSIIIKGMEMPKEESITIQILPSGAVYLEDKLVYEACAVEIPTPHGRLVDVDDFMRHLISNVADLRTLSTGTVGKALHDTPTVIEAERSEE